MYGEARGLREPAHFLDKPRLADAGLAADMENMAAASADGRRQHALELLDLGDAADERAARRRLRRKSRQPPDKNRRGETLDLGLTERLAEAAIGDGALDSLRDQGLARPGERDEPRGEVHAVAEHRVVGRAHTGEAAGDHLAAGDADMRVQRTRRAFARACELGVDVERGARRPERIVVMRHRRPEQRHNGVADVLVDRAAVADDDAVDERREARHEVAHLLGIERLRKRREVAEVGEQDRHLPTFGGVRRMGFGARRRCRSPATAARRRLR